MQKGKCGNKELQSIKRCPADKNELLNYYRPLKYHMCYLRDHIWYLSNIMVYVKGKDMSNHIFLGVCG